MHEYNAKQYWDQRLASDFRSVGKAAGTTDLGGGQKGNYWLYLLRVHAWNKIASRLSLRLSSLSVCDIGCGTGFWAEYFSQRGVQEYVGVDISPTAVNKLKEKYPNPNYRFLEADLGEDIPLADQFDIVNIIDVLYHIIDESRFQKALWNAALLTKPGGLLVIADYFDSPENFAKELAPHVRVRDRQIYEAQLRSNGLEVLGLVPVFYFLGRSIGIRVKDPQCGVLSNALLYPLYYHALGYPLLYLVDRLIVDHVAPTSPRAKTKLLYACKHQPGETICHEV